MTMSRSESWYVETEGPQEKALQLGLEWLLKQSHPAALLAVPSKQILKRSVLESVLTARGAKNLAKHNELTVGGCRIKLMTERLTCYSFDGPVLAVYPSSRLLDSVDSLAGVTAVLVIPWTALEVHPWIRAWNARALGASAPPPDPEFSNPVVKVALESLTGRVNVSTGLGHPSDKAAAIELFKILRRGGEGFDPAEIRGWLISCLGWLPDTADEVADVARRVLEGRRFQLRTRGGWVHDILAEWRTRAGQGQST